MGELDRGADIEDDLFSYMSRVYCPQRNDPQLFVR